MSKTRFSALRTVVRQTEAPFYCLQFFYRFSIILKSIMDTQELKKLLKGSTAVLILEDGEPSFVILGYDAYKGLLGDRPAPEVDIPLRRGDDGNKDDRGTENGSTRGQYRHGDTGNWDKETKNVSTRRQYRHGDGQFQHRVGEKEAEMLEKINKQILALKDEVEKEEKSAGNVDID